MYFDGRSSEHTNSHGNFLANLKLTNQRKMYQGHHPCLTKRVFPVCGPPYKSKDRMKGFALSFTISEEIERTPYSITNLLACTISVHKIQFDYIHNII